MDLTTKQIIKLQRTHRAISMVHNIPPKDDYHVAAEGMLAGLKVVPAHQPLQEI